MKSLYSFPYSSFNDLVSRFPSFSRSLLSLFSNGGGGTACSELDERQLPFLFNTWFGGQHLYQKILCVSLVLKNCTTYCFSSVDTDAEKASWQNENTKTKKIRLRWPKMNLFWLMICQGRTKTPSYRLTFIFC